MEISKAAVGLAATVCIAAGAGGAYFATRGGAAQATPRDEAAIAAQALAPNAAVEQSEAVVTDAPPPPAPAERQFVPAERIQARTRDPQPSTARRTRPREPNVPSAPPATEERYTPPAPVEPPLVTDNQPALSLEPAGPEYEDLVVAADSVIGLQIESTVTSESARVEDQVVARVTRDVRVGDRVVIPAGSRANGEVTLVERGGKMRERARLGVRFTSIVLADGTRVPIQTETVFREGDAPGGESAAKIGGGAIGGAIIGGILGGAKGAAIGGSVGAGAGTAAVMAGGRNPATLSAGAPVTVRIEEPITVTVEK